jgi:hypothetical protein
MSCFKDRNLINDAYVRNQIIQMEKRIHGCMEIPLMTQDELEGLEDSVSPSKARIQRRTSIAIVNIVSIFFNLLS